MRKLLTQRQYSCEEKEHYRVSLLFDYSLNVIAGVLFQNYNHIYNRIDFDKRHGLPDVGMDLVGDEVFSFRMFALNADTFCIETYTKCKLNEEKTTLSITGNTDKDTIAFLDDSVGLIINQLASTGASIKEDEIVKSSQHGFMKKIKHIQKEESMHRYTIVFEDNTLHNILCPHELPSAISPGDFGHLDENQSISFIHRNSIC